MKTVILFLAILAWTVQVYAAPINSTKDSLINNRFNVLIAEHDVPSGKSILLDDVSGSQNKTKELIKIDFGRDKFEVSPIITEHDLPSADSMVAFESTIIQVTIADSEVTSSDIPETSPLSENVIVTATPTPHEYETPLSIVKNFTLEVESQNTISANIGPNPVEGEAFLQMNLLYSSNLNILIIDLLGRALSRQRFEAQAGANELKLPTSGLAAGTYYVHITNDKELRSVVPFIKRN